jgi:CheY-like chemotaxis protein
MWMRGSRARQMFQSSLAINQVLDTPPGGQILVSAGEAPGRQELVQVSVTDTGCGIPQDEHERIFDRLYQIKTGDATTEQGVGLGLYLCRELVQLHGGNIWVESEPGKGSTFSFVLPGSQHLIQSNVLIIDDDPDTLPMLRELLSAEHYNVRTARDGTEALREMQRQVPDIVLLDWRMPHLDGPATLKEIRKNWGPIPVIVHISFTDSDLVKQALAFSPLTLLAKPCTANQVLETVRTVQQSGDTAIWKKNHYGRQRSRC